MFSVLLLVNACACVAGGVALLLRTCVWSARARTANVPLLRALRALVHDEEAVHVFAALARVAVIDACACVLLLGAWALLAVLYAVHAPAPWRACLYANAGAALVHIVLLAGTALMAAVLRSRASADDLWAGHLLHPAHVQPGAAVWRLPATLNNVPFLACIAYVQVMHYLIVAPSGALVLSPAVACVACARFSRDAGTLAALAPLAVSLGTIAACAFVQRIGLHLIVAGGVVRSALACLPKD